MFIWWVFNMELIEITKISSQIGNYLRNNLESNVIDSCQALESQILYQDNR